MTTGIILSKLRLASRLAGKKMATGLLLLFVAAFASAQVGNIPVSGKVTDEQGKALPGAVVTVKGTKTSTSTDNDGNFSLRANSGSMLVISFVGYNNLEQKASSNPMTVQLHLNDQQLDAVVVVGYGTQKKVNLTGAVEQISAKVLEDRPINRLSEGLQGAVAGLNILTNTNGGAPNSTQTINVRGYTGLGSTGAPLIVIDGVQGGDINSINPSDVESISVIKDAASAAIYGSSAPYGVILINTKKGKAGAAPSVTYSNSLAWAQPINLPKMMNSLDFAQIYNEAYANAGRGVAFKDEVIQRMRDYQAGKITDQTVKAANGSDTWGTWFEGNANNDWFKIYFKDLSFRQQHNLGVSGGGNNSTYYLGIGYNDRAGMYNYGDDQFKRFNLRANVSTNVTKWMTIGLRTSMARSDFNTPNTYSGRTGGNYMHQIARKFPNIPLYNPDGGYADVSDIPLHEDGGRVKQTKDEAVLTGELQLKPLKGWDIVANYTFDGYWDDQSSHTKTVYFMLPSGNLSPIGGSTPNGYARYNGKYQHNIINLYTSYEKEINKHYFKALAGYVQEETSLRSINASNSLLYSDDIPSLSTTYNPTATATDAANELAIQGYFGRINYSYDGKYLLELNGRYDGTSRFLNDARWKFYPGFSAGWNVDREFFWEDIKPVVNSLKIRGSYGSLGDQSFLGSNWYPFYPSLGTTAPTRTNWLFGSSQQAAVTMPSLVNTDLTWVTSTTYGFGVDAGFFRKKLTVSFDWYTRTAKDYAGPSQVLPAVLGASVPQSNNTSIETRGIEITALWRDHIGNVSYSLRGTLSDYHGKVLEYPNPNKLLSTWSAGDELGGIRGYTSTGLYTADNVSSSLPASFWTGRWQAGDVMYADLDHSGRIDNGNGTTDNPGDLRIIGNNTPRYQYGFLTEWGWKGFDLSLFIQGVAKRDAWVGSNYMWGIVSSEFQSSPFTVHKNTWSETNTNGYFPRPYMNTEVNKNQQVQTRYLQNAAYMRIKSLQLGYNLPDRISSKVLTKKLRIYASIENLATFTKLIKTMDPELSISDAKIYPLQRTYSCGVNITF